MRLLKIFALLACIFAVGCASIQQTERGVYLEQNKKEIFYSSDAPRLMLQFDAGLKYIGHTQEEKPFNYADSTIGGSHLTTDYYLFVESGINNRLKRMGIILIIELKKGYLASDLYAGLNPNLTSGIKDILGQKYQIGATFGGLGQDIAAKNIEDKGYIIPNALLVKMYGKRFGVDMNIGFHIIYAEDLNSYKEGKYSKRQDWLDKSKLNIEQEEILKTFLAKADKSLSVVEYDDSKVKANAPHSGVE